ncbi:hypothetical protein T10_7093 [Trichinella papuae]|uniref:Uncharacterized protein n=1 Tax=Trichinella papuae TaxID=268474 RepID=A0A0V1M0E9_9BILA|nr:hypothetical protein T10_7093 [Trichinella papuae]
MLHITRQGCYIFLIREIFSNRRYETELFISCGKSSEHVKEIQSIPYREIFLRFGLDLDSQTWKKFYPNLTEATTLYW